jgi:methylmalonyl-CoA/ethylmalonyl-CoA epimerase
MFKVKTIDHVAIAVPDLAPTATALGSLFGLSAGARENVTDQKTEVVFLQPDQASGQNGSEDGSDDGSEDPSKAGSGGPSLELICPNGNASLERFLSKRGPGLHHICFEVEDLPGALADLKSQGVPLIDESPRPGARGHLVAFLHPRATGGVLFELCQKL